MMSTNHGLTLSVIPVVVQPLQVLILLLPAIGAAVLSVIVSLFRPRAVLAMLKVAWRLRVELAVVVLFTFEVVAVANALIPRGMMAEGRSEATSDTWPLFRGDLARTGTQPGSESPTAATLNWSFRPRGQSFYASPAVVGDRLYIAGGEVTLYGGSGTIYCLDAHTGRLIWRNAPTNYAPTYASPSIIGDNLVIGEGLHTERNARIVCMDRHSGKVRWTHRTTSHVECSPVIADGRVYVGAGDDGYYCLDLKGDGNGNAKVLWHLPGEKYPDAETSLIVHDGKVYAGLGVAGQALCVIDAATGKELNRIAMPYPVFSPPAIAGGRLYIGMGTGDMINRAEQLKPPMKPAGEVRCFDLDTLEQRWVYPVGRTILGAVAVRDDMVYFGSRDGHLYALDTDGKRVARWNARAPITTSPAVSDRHVFVVTERGMLYVLDRQTLEPAWEYRLGMPGTRSSPVYYTSSPAVAHGKVYVGTGQDGLLCLGQVREQAHVWSGPRGGMKRGGSADGAPLPKAGALQWSYPADNAGQASFTVTAPIAAFRAAQTSGAATSNTRLLVPFADGDKGGVACLDPGRMSMDGGKPLWTVEAGLPVHGAPAIAAGRGYAVTGGDVQTGREVIGFDLATGRANWRQPVGANSPGILAASSHHLLVQTTDNLLRCYDHRGRKRWQHAVGALAHAPTFAHGIIVLATRSPDTLFALDGDTGRLLWRAPLPHAPTTAPLVRGSTITLGTEGGIDRRSLINGARHEGWSLAGGGVSGDFVVAGEGLAYVNTDGRLVIVSADDGHLVRTVMAQPRRRGAKPAPAVALVGSAPLVSRDRLLFIGPKHIMVIELDDSDATARPWVEYGSWLNRPTGAMVAVDSGIYIGMERWGLVSFGAAR